jgi:hypothetical protein
MHQIYWLVQELSAFQEGLCSTQLNPTSTAHSAYGEPNFRIFIRAIRSNCAAPTCLNIKCYITAHTVLHQHMSECQVLHHCAHCAAPTCLNIKCYITAHTVLHQHMSEYQVLHHCAHFAVPGFCMILYIISCYKPLGGKFPRALRSDPLEPRLRINRAILQLTHTPSCTIP